MKKFEYVMTMNSKQARTCLKAIELLMRLKIRQFDVLPYNVIDIMDDDYCKRRDAAKKHLDAMENALFPTWDHVVKDAEWYRLYNEYQVLRKALHDAERPNSIGVDAYPPVQLTDEPLPGMEWREIDADGEKKGIRPIGERSRSIRKKVSDGSAKCAGCSVENPANRSTRTSGR